MQVLGDQWHQQRAQKLRSRFGEDSTNKKLEYEKGSSRNRAYTGKEAAEAIEAEVSRPRRTLLQRVVGRGRSGRIVVSATTSMIVMCAYEPYSRAML